MKLKEQKMKMVLAGLLAALAAGPSFGSSCSSYQSDKAQAISERAARKIVDDSYSGGQDITVTMKSCEYNSYSEKFKTELDIYWNGAFMRSNRYNIEGVLTFDSDGSGAEFSRTYASESVKKFQRNSGIAAGVIVLGAMAAAAEEEAKEKQRQENQIFTPTSGLYAGITSNLGQDIYIRNECSHPIRMALHFLSSDTGSWETGVWRFDAGEGYFLRNDKTRIRTNNKVIYLFAKSTDGSGKEWGGNDYGKFRKLNRDLPIDVRLTCAD